MAETSPETVEKDELVRRIQNGYRQFEAILAPLSEAQMTTPNVNGPWSVKDNLAHLTVWQEYLRSHLEGIPPNHEPPEFMPGLSTEDEINERIYHENKDRSLAEVQAAFHASYQRVLAAVQALSEAALNAPLPWRASKGPLWPFIVGNTFGHYEEHGDIIQRWLAGDQ